MLRPVVALLSVGILTISSGMTFADPITTTAAVPKNLHVYSNAGDAFVEVGASGCSGAKYVLPADHAKYDAILSMLLAAKVSGSQVKIRFDGCNANGQGLIVGVYLP